MRTRANVEGVVLSIGLREGVRLDEKPWSMLNLHIWDGEHVAEVVAFGSSITSQMLTIRPGNKLKIVSAEFGLAFRFATIENRPTFNKSHNH